MDFEVGEIVKLCTNLTVLTLIIKIYFEDTSCPRYEIQYIKDNFISTSLWRKDELVKLTPEEQMELL